jgi:uncharacterized protein (DUF3820 family)
VSFKPLALDDALPFGKYKDWDVSMVIDADPDYLDWARSNTSLQFTEDVIEQLEFALSIREDSE